MTRAIEVARLDDGAAEPLRFEAIVRDGVGETRHLVSMTSETFRRLAAGATAEQCLRAIFRFLLEREPKEAILARFDVSVISRYFPDFERELPNYLGE